MKNKADQKIRTVPKPENSRINGVQVVHVKTLEELQSVCEQTIDVLIQLPTNSGVKAMLVPIRVLRPNESEKLELILKEAHPPLIDVPQPDGTVRKEYVPNQETLEKSARLHKEVRAMALWWTCALFRESEEGKKLIADGEKRQSIFDFIQSKFTESILEKLYSVARADEFQLEDRVNFTTPRA